MNIGSFLDICGISYNKDQLGKLQELVNDFMQSIFQGKDEIESEFPSYNPNYNDFVKVELEDDYQENTYSDYPYDYNQSTPG